MSPPYIFRINEIRETDDAPVNNDCRSPWVPSIDPAGHRPERDGASGLWWYCNGQQIIPIPNLPRGSTQFQTTTMYYNGGFGFWVSQGDSTQVEPDWQPLMFEHDENDYSSYMTNVAEHTTLRCTRPDQTWPQLLLPDIYYGAQTTYPQYGGLKGDITILLALIAFSMQPALVAQMIPFMFTNAAWNTHQYRHGRRHGRGVTVWVYTCPATWAVNSTGAELRRFESGQGPYGKYYN